MSEAPPERRRWRIPRWIRYAAAALAFFSLLYYIAMAPSNVERLARFAVERYTGGSLELEVKRASLLFGFDIHNINLKSRATGLPLFRAKRLKLSVYLPAILVGHAGVRELTLERPEFYLDAKDGRSNWSDFLPQRERTAAPAAEVQEERPRRTRIPLYLTFKVYGNINVRDFRLYYSNQVGEKRTSLKLENVDLTLAFITREFDEIPLNLSALDLFDTFIFALNPYRPIKIDFKGPRELSGAFKAAIYLYRETSGGQTEFASRLNVDSSLLQLRKPGEAARPLALNLYYDIAYDAPGDRVLIRRVELKRNERRWLALSATVSEASSVNRRLDLALTPSTIDVDDLADSIATLAGLAKAPFRGDRIDLERLSLRGRMDRLEMDTRLSARTLDFGSVANPQRLEEFRIDASAQVDLYQALPFLDQPEGYRARDDLAFGVFYRLLAPELLARFNGAQFTGDASILPDAGVKLNLAIRNFNFERFAPRVARGVAEARLTLSSPENFSRFAIDGALRITGLRYYMGRSRSGLHTVALNTKGVLSLGESVDVRFETLRLDARSPAGAPMLNLAAAGLLSFGKGRQLYDLNISDFDVHYQNLHPALPGQLQYAMQPAKVYLSQGISLRTRMRIESSTAGMKVDGAGELAVPFLKLTDLKFATNMFFGEREIRFATASLDGLRGALSLRLSGALKKIANEWEPDLKLALNVARNELFAVHENISLQGSFKADVALRPESASGLIDMRDLSVELRTGNCARPNSPACRKFFVDRMNLNLPFEHSRRFDPRRSPGPGIGGEYFNTYGRSGRPNLSLASLSSNQTPNGAIAPEKYFYLGSPRGDAGLTARVDYSNNTLLLSWLRLATFKLGQGPNGPAWTPNGVIDGRSIFFSLADLKPENMGFAANLQIKNLDLQPFLPETQSNYDGVISADLKASCANLSDPLYNISAQANVFRISREFSGFVTRILMPSQIVALMVRNTLEIPNIRTELRGGLVYSYITIKRGGLFPGLLIAPGDEEIKQERMPLAQFLDRARSEVQDFGRKGVSNAANDV